MHFAQYNNCDTINGEGIRCSLWVSGCTLKCKGCFSPDAQNFDHGLEFDLAMANRILMDLNQSHIRGLSILGGHMFEEPNIKTCVSFLATVKFKFPKKNVYVWSGLTLDKIQRHSVFVTALEYIDVLIDGPFIESLKDLELPLRGSSNQRVLKKGLDF